MEPPRPSPSGPWRARLVMRARRRRTLAFSRCFPGTAFPDQDHCPLALSPSWHFRRPCPTGAAQAHGNIRVACSGNEGRARPPARRRAARHPESWLAGGLVPFGRHAPLLRRTAARPAGKAPRYCDLARARPCARGSRHVGACGPLPWGGPGRHRGASGVAWPSKDYM